MADSYKQLVELLDRKLPRRQFIKAAFGTLGLSALTPAVFAGIFTPSPERARQNVIDFYTMLIHFGSGSETPELVAVIDHLYTPEDCLMVQHLSMLVGKTADDIPDSGLTASQKDAILENLRVRGLITGFGVGEAEYNSAHMDNTVPKEGYPHENPIPPIKYHMLPLLPGLFESSFFRWEDSDWFRQYAVLWESLYNSGKFAGVIVKDMIPRVTRFVPVEEAVVANDPTPLPSDRMSEILSAADVIAVGTCQCKVAKLYGEGGGCISRTTETCIILGQFAASQVAKGLFREIDYQEAMDIKLAAYEDGLVSWGFDTVVSQANFMCSCCKCCCEHLRMITQFDCPGTQVQPNYHPKHNADISCTRCPAPCLNRCPVNARYQETLEDGTVKTRANLDRCIGCGLCAMACLRSRVLMIPADVKHEPSDTFKEMFINIERPFIRNTLSRLLSFVND